MNQSEIKMELKYIPIEEILSSVFQIILHIVFTICTRKIFIIFSVRFLVISKFERINLLCNPNSLVSKF
ncbi:hypothetical protein V1477_001468 [Vespula maculifrons]|uniref:Uncharacterized protein n=1 Tax=Vespula maculifrons TaxID=7453 RepID=A0ABD2CYT2_VESMC